MLKNLEQKKIQKLRDKAKKQFDGGNVLEAKKNFTILLEMGAKGALEGIQKCSQVLLRKAWRKDDLNMFLNSTESPENFALEIARMKGKEALAELSLSCNSLNGQLAGLSAILPVKEALMKMRRVPSLKEISEGWIALLKMDLDKAQKSFQNAHAKGQEVRADLGLGLIYCIRGQQEKTEELLKPLRPFAVKKYPIISETLGWSVLDKCETEEAIFERKKGQLAFLLRKGSKEELQKSLSFQMPSTLKAFVLLRLGDLEYASRSYTKAITNWKKAKQSSDLVKLDVMKRFLFAETDELSSDKRKVALSEIYTGLLEKDADDAKSFLEHIVLYGSDSFVFASEFLILRASAEEVPIKDASPKDLHKAPTELKLLYLKSTLSQADNFEKKLPPFFLRSTPRYKAQDWKPLLNKLEKDYLDEEAFWRLLLRFQQEKKGSTEAHRKAYFNLLRINPRLEKEFLEKYAETSLATIASHKQINKELETLTPLFPKHYDLLRVYSKLKNSPKSPEELIKILPAALRPIFLLETLVDRSKSLPTNWRSKLPALENCGKDFEADQRLLGFLYEHTHLSRNETFSRYFKKIASNPDLAESLVKKLVGENIKTFISLPEYEMLYQLWLKTFPDEWRPYFHLAHHHGVNNNGLTSGKYCKEALKRMSGEETEYHFLEKMVDQYENPMEYDDDFEDDYDDDFEEEDFMKDLGNMAPGDVKKLLDKMLGGLV
ncbi:MAG: hypothetical protein ACI8RA_002034 [Chlamydiales bacterium]|jgi:hypothetical protein